MSNTKNKKRLLALPAVIILVHCVYVFLLYLQVPLNSDHANQILQASDILNGNVLLKGWNLTGVSFYLSEIPFYVFGTAIAGVDTYAYVIAAASMVMALFALGYINAFAEKAEHGVLKALTWCALAGMPTLTRLGYLRGHCAIFVYFMLCLICLRRIFADEGRPAGAWLALGLLTACGCMSDMQLVIICVLPTALYCLINLLSASVPFGTRRNLGTVGVLLGGTGLGMVLDKLLMTAGGINKNSFLDTRKFVDMDRLGEKFLLLGKGLLNSFGAEFPLTGRGYIGLAFAWLVILLTLTAIALTARNWIRDGKSEPTAAICALSILVMLGVCFFTDIYTSEDSARYIAFIPFAAGILICRSFEKYFAAGQGRIAIPLFLIALVAFALPVSFSRVESPQDRLAAFLEENGLTYGYADFWNASHTTVASNDRVRVRAVRVRAKEVGKPDYLAMQNWFCKTEWYADYSGNFIAFDGSGYLDVREDYIRELLGEPDRILDSGEYVVYVYERGLGSEIVPE